MYYFTSKVIFIILWDYFSCHFCNLKQHNYEPKCKQTTCMLIYTCKGSCLSRLLLTLKSNFEHALFGKSLRVCLSVFYAKQSVTFIFLMEGFELYKLQTFFIRHFWPLLFCIDSMCLHGSMCVCILYLTFNLYFPINFYHLWNKTLRILLLQLIFHSSPPLRGGDREGTGWRGSVIRVW